MHNSKLNVRKHTKFRSTEHSQFSNKKMREEFIVICLFALYAIVSFWKLPLPFKDFFFLLRSRNTKDRKCRPLIQLSQLRPNFPSIKKALFLNSLFFYVKITLLLSQWRGLRKKGNADRGFSLKMKAVFFISSTLLD